MATLRKSKALETRWEELGPIEDGFGGWHPREWRLYKGRSLLAQVKQRAGFYTLEVRGQPAAIYQHETLLAVQTAAKRALKLP